MRSWLRGRPGGLAAFLLIAALVAGGLGWATRAALLLEREQIAQQAQGEEADRLRLALWRLDSRITAILAREESRPFNHFSAVFATPLALDGMGRPWPPGVVVEPSPLLNADLPPWMLLHFQTDKAGWGSPQVLSPTLDLCLRGKAIKLALTNVTVPRKQLLAELSRELPASVLLAHVRKHAGQAIIRDRVLLARQQAELTQNSAKNPLTNEAQNYREYAARSGEETKLGGRYGHSQCVDKDLALLNLCRNGEEWLNQANTQKGKTLLGLPSPLGGIAAPPRMQTSARVVVSMSPMGGQWLPTTAGRARLVVMRLVRLEETEVCQGIVLDADKLGELLGEEVQDLFPGASVLPARDPAPEQLPQTMTSLPLYLDTGDSLAADDPGWTPLCAGLSLAWAAALVALLAVGLGGWSLLSLSERRIRFVSAVTHELRTPLTTLQLYLDMLLGGLVRDEKQRTEYLQTLHAETGRLTQLVGNVLDFSRLESRRPNLILDRVAVGTVLDQVQAAWAVRCAVVDKELVVKNACPPETAVQIDAGLLQQVLGNLLDNACKYSREAEDRRIWLRAKQERGRVVFEVEDRGPGVPMGERRTIFRAFRRGCCADAATGGVGLGLALARRWTHLLGGRLAVVCPAERAPAFGWN